MLSIKKKELLTVNIIIYFTQFIYCQIIDNCLKMWEPNIVLIKIKMNSDSIVTFF